MAVNKNFVVKNGIEVNTNLIVADTDSNKVGIGTTVPEYTLHVFEGTGIGASMVYVTGISTSLEEFNVGVGGTTFTAISNAGAGIAGSVGVGTDLPGYLLEVHAPVSTGQTALYVKGDMHVTGDINLDDITLNELKVTGISTFENSIFVGSGATVGLNTVHFADHAKAMFGDGEDLKVYHDGSNSYISDTGTGGLIVGSNSLTVKNAALNETQAVFTENGAVELYYDNTKRFETNAIGVEVSGTFESTGITTLASSGGITTTGGDLYVGGDLYISEDITLDTNLSILGIATIGTLQVSSTSGINTILSTVQSTSKDTGSLVLEGGLGVEKSVFIGDGLDVTGIATVHGGSIDIANAVRHIGDPNTTIAFPSNDTVKIETAGTDQLIIGPTGIATFAGVIDANDTTQSSSSTTGAAKFAGGVGIEKNLFVGGGAEVTGITTITGTLDANGALDVDGHTELDDVNVAGASTFTGAADFNGAVDIDGHTELDDVNVSGTATITTFNVGTAGQSGLVGITTILDEDNMASNSATALVTQQSIKAYVDTQLTAEDLDFGGDSGTGSVDLDSQTFTIAGTANEIETSASSQTLTIGLPNFVTVSNGLNVTGNGSTTTTLNVTGVSTFQSHVHLGDSDELRFGAKVGGDLVIVHDGDHGVIDNNDGNLNIKSEGNIEFNPNNTADGLRIINQGAVELFHNNSKKFETGPAGTITVGVGTFDGLSLGDNEKALFGTGDDLEIYHDGTDSWIDNTEGDLYLRTSGSGDDIIIRSADDILIQSQASEASVICRGDGQVELYHNNSLRLETTTDGIDLGTVATGAVGIVTGTTAQRPSSPKAGDFRYNLTTGEFEGYTNAWGAIGGGGGISTSYQEVESTSATGISTFSTTAFRSAHMIVGITQGTSYQTGRYLIIHDNTTPTILEESALATGDMLGTFDATIAGGNLTVRVTMGNAGLATVAVKMDTINSDSSS